MACFQETTHKTESAPTQNGKRIASLYSRLHWFEHRSRSHWIVILRALGLARATPRTPHKRAADMVAGARGYDTELIHATTSRLPSRSSSRDVSISRLKKCKRAADQSVVLGRWYVPLQLGDGSHRGAHVREADVVHRTTLGVDDMAVYLLSVRMRRARPRCRRLGDAGRARTHHKQRHATGVANIQNSVVLPVGDDAERTRVGDRAELTPGCRSRGLAHPAGCTAKAWVSDAEQRCSPR